MKPTIKSTYLLLLLTLILGGCAGQQSFTTAANPGETIALALGYRQNLQRQNLTVTITDSVAQTMTYSPGSTKVKAVFNLYPDPASKVVVGYVTNQDMGVNAKAIGGAVSSSNYPGATGTSGDSDWWETTMLLDVPTTMSNNQSIAPGIASISIADSAGAMFRDIKVNVLSGSSASNPLNIFYNATSPKIPLINVYSTALHSLERANNSTVTFTSTTMPHSLQVEFTHDQGVGVPWVINPRGDIKNVTWTDTGTTLRVMIEPTTGATLTKIKDLKFYIAGGLTNVALSPNSLKAYDINGSPITGVTATVTAQ